MSQSSESRASSALPGYVKAPDSEFSRGSPVLRKLSSRFRPPSADTREQGMDIKHGILPDYNVRVPSRIRTVIFHPALQSSVVHHKKGFSVYARNSRETDYEDCGGGLDLVLNAVKQELYVGVCGYHLKLLNQSFEQTYQVEIEHRILSAVYNTWSGEVVTSSAGQITTWMFRQGGKVIIPNQTITDGLLPADEPGHLHLEDVPGQAQRCFAAVRSGVKVFLLSSGRLLADLRELHTPAVSALLFFRPLRLLITAAKDGAIKVWDSSWQLCCTFVGHRAAVSCLVPYPYGPMVVSGSIDATIRVWNLSSHDQVEVHDHTVPVEGLLGEPGSLRLLSYSTRQIKVWRVQRLYCPHALVGSKVTLLSTSTHPLVPLRALVACADSAVRLVAPTTGEVITTALLPLGQRVAALAYFSFAEVLYVLDGDGTITMFSTQANPAKRIAGWTSNEEIGCFVSVAVYEAALDEEEIEELLSHDRWLGVALEARRLSHSRLPERDPLEVHREGESLLLAGTERGHLALLDPHTGSVKCSIKAHDGPVSLILCNAKNNQVVTATSTDAVLQVWLLYPHSLEAFSLSESLQLRHPPALLAGSRERLCVASNHSDSNSFTITMYCLAQHTSFSSQPEHCHTDDITGLGASPKMRLFASCACDCTVRVWTEDNHPLRVLHLDCPPEGLLFCSLQADLYIALHAHLHTIASATFLSEELQKVLVSLRLPDQPEERQRAWEAGTSLLPQEDRYRLELVDNTISEDSYRGALSAEEMAELERAEREREEEIARLRARELELRGIREGLVTSSRRRTGLRGREKERAWRQLLLMLHPPPVHRIVVPEQDDFDPDTYGKVIEPPEPYSPYSSGPRYKFFPPLATFDPPYPVAPDGLLPNSMLLQELRKSAADQRLAEQWAPPSLSCRQQQLMEEMQEESEEEEEEVEESDSDLMARLQAAMEVRTPTPSPPPTPTPSPPPTPPKRVVVSRKPIEKLIAPKATPKPPTPPLRTPTPPPPKSPTPPPTPPPPPTPLPEFIAQFIGRPWFDGLFPNASSKTFPQPWTVTRFIFDLLSCLSRTLVDSTTKADICAAILKLLERFSPTNREEVCQTSLSLLTGPPPPSSHSLAERRLVVQALKLVFATATDEDVPGISATAVLVLLLHLADGDFEVQEMVRGFLTSIGLEDPLGYLTRVMSRLGAEASTSGSGVWLLAQCQAWLEHWAEQLLQSKAPKLLKNASPTKKVLKGGLAQRSRKQKVTFGAPPAPSSLPRCNPVEVLNYFVRIEHENELARQRVVTPPPSKPPTAEEELLHNTVIPLPKIQAPRGLIRLGETHCSRCHPERETSLALLHRLPPLYNAAPPQDPTRLWHSFTHCLSLALKPQNINPFLTAEELAEAASLELQQARQERKVEAIMKYFVPERSYVQS